jgi:stage V sporulation protein S
MTSPKERLLLAAATTDPKALAGSICHTLRDCNPCYLRAIGVQAVNQAVKAIAIAGDFSSSRDLFIYTTPTFVDIELQGETRSAIEFIIWSRARHD